jgi:hypothetical protein
MGASAALPPRPVAAKDPPAPLNFVHRVLAVTSEKPVANQETHLLTVRAMRLLQVPAALIKVRRVGHIRGHPVHGSQPLCARNLLPSSARPGTRDPAPCVRSLRSLSPGPGSFPQYHRLPLPAYDLNPIPISPLPTIPVRKSTGVGPQRHGSPTGHFGLRDLPRLPEISRPFAQVCQKS